MFYVVNVLDKNSFNSQENKMLMEQSFEKVSKLNLIVGAPNFSFA
jgi:hypothetical protein